MVASLAWMRNKVVVGTSITPDRGEGEQNKSRFFGGFFAQLVCFLTKARLDLFGANTG